MLESSFHSWADAPVPPAQKATPMIVPSAARLAAVPKTFRTLPPSLEFLEQACLWHHDHVAAPQQDVLLELFPILDVAVVKQNRGLCASLISAQDLDLTLAGERCQPACEAQGLHHVELRIVRKRTRRLDLPDHGDRVAGRLDHRNRHLVVGQIRKILTFPQVVCDFALQLLERHAAGIEVADQREGDPAIGLDWNVLVEILFAIERDVEQIAAIDSVTGVVLHNGSFLGGGWRGNDYRRGGKAKQSFGEGAEHRSPLRWSVQAVNELGPWETGQTCPRFPAAENFVRVVSRR